MKHSDFVKIRRMNVLIVTSFNYINVNFNISKILNDKYVVTRFFKNLHIVNNLSAKILIDMNIIDSEKMTISAIKLRIDLCQRILINVSTKIKDFTVKKVVICAIATTLSFHFNIIIFIKIRENVALLNRDFIFYLSSNFILESENEALSHIVNANINMI